jgi:alkanesulfonate monooxygenase SsuD/methylene tetrahydromethanopterin reductase-like flavin-dependent oxidoreductase (luciferase family)
MDLGVHLPLMQFGREPLSWDRLAGAVDTARERGFAAVSANDHFVFATPWLDGPAALASVIERSGEMTLATTISLPVLRGPVALAKALAAIDVLSGGRVIAGLGPGSSSRDYELAGIRFEDRWRRFDEAVAALRALLNGDDGPRGAPATLAEGAPAPLADVELAPSPAQPGGVPLWIGSWGSDAGLRRVARLADGWLASAYNTTPERFASAREMLARELADRGRDPDRFPNAIATMWTWVAEDGAEGDRVLSESLAPLLRRDQDELRGQVCVGPPEHCAQLLSRYAEAGCERVYMWPLGDERRQIELIAGEVAPRIEGGAMRPASGRRQ